MDYSKGPPLGQIAKELDTNTEGARKFAAQVFKELGGYVTFAEILKALRQTEDPKKATPEVVASLLTPHSLMMKKYTLPTPIPQKSQQDKEIIQISEELNVDIESAEKFIAQVRILLGYHVKYHVMLKAIKQIGKDEQISPEAIASFIPSIPFLNSSVTNQIAEKLSIDVKIAASFIVQVQKLLGRSVKLKAILEVIKQIADREQVTPSQVASLLQKVQPFDKNLFSLALMLKEQIKKETQQAFFTNLNLWLPRR